MSETGGESIKPPTVEPEIQNSNRATEAGEIGPHTPIDKETLERGALEGIRDRLSVLVGDREQETTETVKNIVESFDKLFYSREAVTARGRFPLPERQGRIVERPLFSRAKRAELYKKYKEIPKENKEERKRILEEAHVRDELTAQFLNQGEISIALPGLGEQTARYTRINPPDPLQTEETDTKPPILIIPGISNDIECLAGLVQEIGMEGRKVVIVGFPESYKGEVTQEFSDAVKRDPEFGPHVEFFKNAIKGLMGEEGNLELWGFSTGGTILEKILQDPKFQERTEQAVLICRASSVDQSVTRLKAGVIHDLGFISSPGALPSLSWTMESKTPREKEQKRLRKEVLSSLLKRVSKRFDFWQDAKVQQGGKIIFVTGRKDQITKSYERNNDFVKNTQARVIDLPNGYHATPVTQPELVVPQIFDMQKAEA